MDNLGDIRLFVEAANLGGISAAGRKLGLSPAAASARLVKLEASLATRLFERTTRQLRLTDEGRLYLRHCQQAIQVLDDARAALVAGQSLISGKVRLSATSDFGRHTLNSWLDEFTELYPEVTFALTLSDSLSKLVEDDVDLVIRFGAPVDSSLVARRLAANRRVLCASPQFVARYGPLQHPSELVPLKHIVLSSASGVANEWRFSCGNERETFKVPVSNARETNDGAVARQWAIDGYGVVVKSIWDVATDIRNGKLLILMPAWRLPEAPVHALYQRSRYMAPRVRTLLDFFVERFETESKALSAVLDV